MGKSDNPMPKRKHTLKTGLDVPSPGRLKGMTEDELRAEFRWTLGFYEKGELKEEYLSMYEWEARRRGFRL